MSRDAVPAGSTFSPETLESELLKELDSSGHNDHKVIRILNLALQSAGAGVWEWNFQDGLRWSDEVYRIFGLIPGKDLITVDLWKQSVHPDDLPALTRELEAAYAHRRRVDLEYRIILPTGAIRWIHDIGDFFADADGVPRGRAGICFDITEHKKNELALRGQEQRLNSYVNNSPMAIIEWDADFVVTRWAGGAERIFGWCAAETVGKSIKDLHLIYEEDMPLVAQTMTRLSERFGRHVVSANRNMTRDGRVIHCEWYNTMLTNQRGEMVSVLSQVLDTTEQRAAEEEIRRLNTSLEQTVEDRTAELMRTMEALQASEERLETMVNALPDLMFRVDEHGTLYEFHSEPRNLLYLPPDQFLGRKIADVLPEEPGRIIMAALAEAAEKGSHRGAVYALPMPHGTMWFELSIAAMASTVRHGTHFIVLVRDITQRKQAEFERDRYERELEQSRDTAEAGNRAKSEFLANMSHEIRTPMNGIIGMAQLLRNTVLTAEQREYVDAIITTSDSLLSLTNDFLDLAKIESGMIELEEVGFSLRECIDVVVKTQIFQVRCKGLALEIAIPDDVPDTLAGDQLRLKQILLNLLGNAVKFTEKGGVTVSVAVSERYDGNVLLTVTITDTGTGISPEDLKKIFDPFFQTDPSITRKHGGTGLGLAISTRLADLMGGALRVESSEGAGSSFSVLLPFTVTAAAGDAGRGETAAPAAWHGPPLRLLVADDQTLNLKFAENLLRYHGHSVTLAWNGREALHAWEEGSFDLIVMDIRMPVMDGIEATRVIRKREAGTGRHTPIIAATAHALREEREAILGEGFDGYLVKPILEEALFTEICRCLPEEPCRPAIPQDERPFDDGTTCSSVRGEVRPERSRRVAKHEPGLAGEGESLLLPAIIDGLRTNPELLRAYPGMLLDDLGRELEAMQAAWAARDAGALERAAHSAKGLARKLRDPEPATLAAEIEREARAGSLGMVHGKLSRLHGLYANMGTS